MVEHLTVHGGGWGHGIGMCQVGALGRARAGQRYDEILRTYYTNTEIQKLY
jgi:stage II sporulation protein D